MAVLPVVLVTSVVTALWWFVGVAAVTFPLRNRLTPGPQRPEILYLDSRIAVSLWLGSPGVHVAVAVTLGLVLLMTLPLVTRACVAAQAGLGQVLLRDASVLLRRIVAAAAGRRISAMSRQVRRARRRRGSGCRVRSSRLW